MSTFNLNAEWKIWLSCLAAPLHARLAWRLPVVVLGMLLASGRRTATRWWIAAGVGQGFRSYYYFLDSIGRKTHPIAAALLQIVLNRIPVADRLVFAFDDTPTKRYGPKVQGAGFHHNPTPGPDGSKFLYGHCWVTLSRVAHHARWGAIGLPLLAALYVRKATMPTLPPEAGLRFRTKLQIAAEMVAWMGDHLPEAELKRCWLAVDGGYAKRNFLKPAIGAKMTVVARLRKDAALFDLPAALKPGRKRGRGRPPIYGKNRLSLAIRAGQTGGWTAVEVVTTTGRSVARMCKTFLATWRPAGGVVRVVILKEADGKWRAFLCSDAEANVEEIVQVIVDRWAIEQNYHDLKEVERVGEVQLRRLWANVGAMNLGLWVHTLIEVWGWDRSEGSLCDRVDRPWDDASRRPSHADRRRALQREMVAEEYQRLELPTPWSEKIRDLLAGVVKLVA